ncbi:ABC1 family-domain-containing protein, partial [Baffinella frigidus]
VPAEKGELFARTQVERELGRPISEVFENFEDEPLGSASIGQCHSARLLDGREVVIKDEPLGSASIGQCHSARLLDGREVVIKVMRPDAERLFRGDLDTLEAFCKLAQPQIVPVFDEFRATFPFEFNYTREAHNLARVIVFDEFRATFPFEFNYTREAHNLARAAKDLNKRR